MKRSGGWFCRLWFETCSLFVVYSVYGTKSQSSWQSGGSWTVRAGSMGIDDKVHTSIDNQVLHRTNLPDVPKGVISFFTKRTKKRRLCWLILSKCWRTLLKIVYWIEIFTNVIQTQVVLKDVDFPPGKSSWRIQLFLVCKKMPKYQDWPLSMLFWKFVRRFNCLSTLITPCCRCLRQSA